MPPSPPWRPPGQRAPRRPPRAVPQSSAVRSAEARCGPSASRWPSCPAVAARATRRNGRATCAASHGRAGAATPSRCSPRPCASLSSCERPAPPRGARDERAGRRAGPFPRRRDGYRARPARCHRQGGVRPHRRARTPTMRHLGNTETAPLRHRCLPSPHPGKPAPCPRQPRITPPDGRDSERATTRPGSWRHDRVGPFRDPLTQNSPNDGITADTVTLVTTSPADNAPPGASHQHGTRCA
jgi:hypothetical protein